MKDYRIYKFLICFFAVFLFFVEGNAAGMVKKTDTNNIDKKGRKQGLWIRADSSRNLHYSGFFENDMPTGLFVYTDYKGTKVADAFYFRGGYASYNIFYYPKGKVLSEGYFLDKQRDSLWVYYRENGNKMKEEFYKNGLLDGMARLYDKEGVLIEEMSWFRGLRQGDWWKKEPQGYQTGRYLLNMSEGPYQAFYPDSSLYVNGNYNEGVKNGLWSFYLPSPSKSLFKEELYEKNKLVEKRIFLKVNGSLVKLSVDTLVAVFLNPQGRGDIFTKSGLNLKCDESYETVCKVLDLDNFFYANANVFVAYKFVNSIGGVDSPNNASSANSLGGAVNTNGLNSPSSPNNANEIILSVKLPFPVYADENGVQTVKSMWNKGNMDADGVGGKESVQKGVPVVKESMPNEAPVGK